MIFKVPFHSKFWHSLIKSQESSDEFLVHSSTTGFAVTNAQTSVSAAQTTSPHFFPSPQSPLQKQRTLKSSSVSQGNINT